MKDRNNLDFKNYKKNLHLYCKRKYYQAVCKFYANKYLTGDDNKDEPRLNEIRKNLDLTSILLKTKMKTAHDLRIMLSIYSSY